MLLDEFVEQATRLSEEDRSELIVRLLSTLEEDAPFDPGREAAWTEVIDRRLLEVREGRVEPVEVDDALARVNAAMAAARR